MTENFNEDMNKNIIEALQQQEETEETDLFEEVVDEQSSIDELVAQEDNQITDEDDFSMLNDLTEDVELEKLEEPEERIYEENMSVFEEPVSQAPVEEVQQSDYEEISQPVHEEVVQPVYEETYNTQNVSAHAVVENLADELYQFEIPSNVAVLKKLISQLPSGVTRQTGAQIIKQTMEALGISMKSVLQDAQAVQEKLNNSSKECQATIQEYKRQIATLEEQSAVYKKQYNNLNDLVSLFIQR